MGLRASSRGVRDGVLGKRSLVGAGAARHSEDLVAGHKGGDLGADCFNPSGEVKAEHRRKTGPRVRGLACPDLGRSRSAARRIV
ncbi:MAG: hypothetical protein JWR37_5495 [Mycobacterium sp.]|jgi:hypothetical protein|nr:hypothetical protein [Mycobacterium sp.]